MMNNYIFQDLVVGNEGLLKGPFGSDLKRSLYVPKSKDTYKVYLQENILGSTLDAGDHYISKEYFETKMFRYAVKENDFIVTCDGTLGEIYQLKGIKEPGLISSSLLRITLNPDLVDYDYFYYLFKALIKKELITQANNSVLKHLPGIEVIRNHQISLPNLDVQKRIGIVLKQIDKKIQNNKILVSELESMAKTLYDYWFLQFEFPNEEGRPYKSFGGKMVYNEELKREIPEGWKVENMMESSLCSDIKAGVEKFESKNYLPTANIEGESITDGEYVTFDNRKNRANMQPVKYSVWFAKMKNSIKHLSIPENSGWFINKYILSTGFQGLKCTKTSFAYIHSIINSSWFETYKDILSHGATQEGVNNEDLKNIKYVVPSNNVLIEFNKICMPALEKKFSIIRENQELVSLRDFLLPMLMNGQVTFK